MLAIEEAAVIDALQGKMYTDLCLVRVSSFAGWCFELRLSSCCNTVLLIFKMMVILHFFQFLNVF